MIAMIHVLQYVDLLFLRLWDTSFRVLMGLFQGGKKKERLMGQTTAHPAVVVLGATLVFLVSLPQ